MTQKQYLKRYNHVVRNTLSQNENSEDVFENRLLLGVAEAAADTIHVEDGLIAAEAAALLLREAFMDRADKTNGIDLPPSQQLTDFERSLETIDTLNMVRHHNAEENIACEYSRESIARLRQSVALYWSGLEMMPIETNSPVKTFQMKQSDWSIDLQISLQPTYADASSSASVSDFDVYPDLNMNSSGFLEGLGVSLGPGNDVAFHDAYIRVNLPFTESRCFETTRVVPADKSRDSEELPGMDTKEATLSYIVSSVSSHCIVDQMTMRRYGSCAGNPPHAIQTSFTLPHRVSMAMMPISSSERSVPSRPSTDAILMWKCSWYD